ncbi:PLP-dependent transferase [Methylocapsa acidiphila]|uniref:PLP-dependent transferase n=1 Tax=Methylocapsa acidiphila TaxID=133552 RepID=UPI00040622DB|nr:PLP-dependent transferase [Methylocapsa acidiphila]
MTDDAAPRFATKALHAGAERDHSLCGGAPAHSDIWSMVFDSDANASPSLRPSRLCGVQMQAESRAVALLEERIAALEEGVAAVAFASGRGALLATFHLLMKPGEDIIAARAARGGAMDQLAHGFGDFGMRIKWADPMDLSTFTAAIGPRTKAIFVESTWGPGGAIVDLEAIGSVAKSVGIPLIVDNTAATPYLVRPFEHGADIVVHSAAALLSGRGDQRGGLIIDGGGFNWLQDERYPMLSAPRPEFDGTILANTFGNFSFAVAARALGLGHFGCELAPLDALLILAGVETLALRMQRHCENARTIAEHLARHPAVRWVSYPGLSGDRSNALAQKYCPNGAGAALTLGLTGGYPAAAAVVSRLKLFSALSNFGDARSRALHPASSAERRPSYDGESDEPPDLVRLSIGIEDTNDIIADLDQALAG